jgi:hypothetical protein
MLSQKSIPGPQYKDPLVKVNVLVPFYMGGVLREVGTTISMLSTDARMAATNANPPQVEIL